MSLLKFILFVKEPEIHMFQIQIAAWAWAFAFGLLHTLQPCEDKAIFGFHTFGVAKNNNEAIKIVFIYSLGLFTVDNLIGLGSAFVGTLFQFIIPAIQGFEPYFSPTVTIVIGSILYVRLAKYQRGDNHAALPIALKVRKTLFGTFLLGILTGLPPCAFELTVYIQAMSASTVYFTNGIIHVFFFSIGTIVGMIILTMIVTSFKRLEIFKERNKDTMQKIAIWILLGYGIAALVLSLLGFPIYKAPIQIPVEPT